MNTIVNYQGEQNKEEFFDAQFCPKQEDVRKAVKKFLKTYDSKMPAEVVETLTKETIDRGGVTISSNNTSDWFKIGFEKL